MTTNIRGNSFLTTNKVLIVYNHFFEKLLKNPHIKTSPKHSLSSFLSFSFSLICSLSRSSLSFLLSSPSPIAGRRRPQPDIVSKVARPSRTSDQPPATFTSLTSFTTATFTSSDRRWGWATGDRLHDGDGGPAAWSFAVAGDLACKTKEEQNP